MFLSVSRLEMLLRSLRFASVYRARTNGRSNRVSPNSLIKAKAFCACRPLEIMMRSVPAGEAAAPPTTLPLIIELLLKRSRPKSVIVQDLDETGGSVAVAEALVAIELSTPYCV